MTKNSEIIEMLDKVSAAYSEGLASGNTLVESYKESFSAKHKGRSPLFEYENLQKRIFEVAPRIKLKDGSYKTRGHSFATLVYESFLREGVEKVQKPAQIRNLIDKGLLVLPPDPVVEEVVTAADVETVTV